MGSPTTMPVPPATAEAAHALELARRYWWVRLITGVAWCAAALVILQFDQASVTTVGIIIGVMFAVAAAEQFALGAVAERLKWLWYVFGVLFAIAAVISFIRPKNTFAGVADILGFLFLLIGVWWTIEAFVVRDSNPVWWLGLIGGLLMLITAFWTSGQFFIDKAYILLVFSGVWALMQGVMDIVRAFAIRSID